MAIDSGASAASDLMLKPSKRSNFTESGALGSERMAVYLPATSVCKFQMSFARPSVERFTDFAPSEVTTTP